jgi:O-acetyl-ADP-ribose deacetylase (regulator of RNase III)
MKVSVFVGDIADADAEAVCTSTNSRLSLVMGTGASIRARGGIEILRACEEIVDAAERRQGRRTLAPGTAHVTTAGQLPHEIAIHCVASDDAHESSEAIIRSCVQNALRRADERGCTSVAMPVFATGHAHAKFDRAIRVMAEEIRGARTSVRQITIVVSSDERAEDARSVLADVLQYEVPVSRAVAEVEAPISWWSAQQ